MSGHAALRELFVLSGAASRLAGYATTCRRHNESEWLDGLVLQINAVLAEIGDDDRVERHEDELRVVPGSQEM